MPIYEFRCRECQHDFQALRRSDQVDSVTCPSCGARRVIRLLSVTAQTPSSDTAAGRCEVNAGAGRCALNPEACGCRF
ncbi:MAG: zinc ribbon domain-containing protein [Chloroherpetonaceae bacterium]|nr:zinc ribbon domain-containing protein [Chthonomonadaceae bacterium]MDW8208940.1 zinc ribbon domain-containing protein [Chloroherpetonaceae bacterium]